VRRSTENGEVIAIRAKFSVAKQAVPKSIDIEAYSHI
jgi:hypothetical protein